MALDKKKDFFWLSYSDLMTSMFFVMLVLFVLIFNLLNNKIGEMSAAKEELDEIHKIQAALEKLDTNYYKYDIRNKRYKLKVDVKFGNNSFEMTDIPPNDRVQLLSAGMSLYNLMEEVTKENPNVNYLLVVEGNAQRSRIKGGSWNYLTIPNEGYELSYKRALALINYWQRNNLDFKKFGNCEIMISGSGHFGKSRELNEGENRKFSIQITPKIGQFKKNKKT